MSLSTLVGPIEIPAAFMLAVFAITVCIIVTTMIAKRRSRRSLEMEHELEMTKLANAQQLALKRQDDTAALDNRKIEAETALERERIGQNLITSHSSRTSRSKTTVDPPSARND